MRVMPFFQVLLFLTLLTYLLLVALENPGLVKLPLPFGQGEWLLSTGLTVALFAVLGGTYVLLLVLPVLLRTWLRRRTERRERQDLERRLVDTLGARVASVPSGREETVTATTVEATPAPAEAPKAVDA
ncbi:MAG: hypothetical protein Q4C89_05950 [Deinococcus sp.]|uniref:hypothetical protein n=1 Tax=Deinococcus sp. TaxID=47478 RepID=UPI0026DA862D|nr:hypothetical protein [Deinococcus sp.]MDO4245546.1 hypothetical protein [Deinococcus sp.]